jgi:hypothetical protein
MDLIIFVFIAFICINVAVKIFNSEERNKVFNKRPIEVADVKKYNKFCGYLVIGLAAEITLYAGKIFGGLISVLCTLLLIGEAVLVMFIYNKAEVKMLKKR